MHIAPYVRTASLAMSNIRFVTLVKVIVLFILFWVYCWNTLDPDFGWHLQTGNYIREHGIPTHDLFSYTASDFHWIDHEWASDVLVSFIYQLGGYGLLTTVFAGLWTASLCLFRDKLRLSVLLVALLAMLPYVAVRPVVWSLLGLAIILELGTRNTKWSRLLIPPLFLLWANLHGGFVIGLAAIAYFAYLYRDRRWLLILAASAAIPFINPYGPQLYVEIIRTVFDPSLHRQVVEWHSFNLGSRTWLFIALWITGFWLVARRKRASWISFTLLLLLASLSAGRNMLLFVIAALRDIDTYSTQLRLSKGLEKARKILANAFVVMILGVLGTQAVITLVQKPLQQPSRPAREAIYPAEAVAYLQDHPCSGNIFNDYSFGGYLIWKMPGTPIYIDGRMPSWLDKETNQTYMTKFLAVRDTPERLKAEFKKYNIRCALLSPGSLRAITELKKEKWITKYENSYSVLLVAPVGYISK